MPKPIDSSMRDTQVLPEPGLERRTRRQFSTEYKLRIVAEAAQFQTHAHGYQTQSLNGERAESALQLGHHLPADSGARGLFVPVFGDGYLQPQSGGLASVRSRIERLGGRFDDRHLSPRRRGARLRDFAFRQWQPDEGRDAARHCARPRCHALVQPPVSEQ